MTKQAPSQNGLCNDQILSRFADGDLALAEQHEVKRHLENCVDCREKFNRIGLLSDTCRAVMDESRFQKELTGLEGRIMSRIRRPRDWKERGWKEAVWNFFSEKKVLIPVSAAGTILAAFVTFQMFFTSPTTPSAIITSITGDVSSVMIMETPESHQTIIWIKENS